MVTTATSGWRVRRAPAVAPHEVPAVAAQADAALVVIQPVCLSYRFTLPNKLFEAIHAGLPVVAADLPDMAELVTRYRCGELVDPADPAAFVAGLGKLLADPAPYRAAAAELDWDHEAARLVDAYAHILEQRG
jgi:glycosyltransferase involved in cell wall biosynthesis